MKNLQKEKKWKSTAATLNQQLAKELHKPITREFQKIKVY